MAHISTNTGAFPELALHYIAKPFKAFGRLMVQIMEADSRLKRVERLSRMSDEELAKIGIRNRDDIVRHVFANVMYL